MSNDNPTDICVEFQPQIAAYALGEQDLASDVLAHLDRCPSCQSDLDEYARVAHLLPYSAPLVTPPPELRTRVIAAVEQNVSLQTKQPERRRTAPPPQAPYRPAPRLPAFAFAAVAVVALLGLLGWNISLQRQVDTLASQVSTSRENWRTMTALLNSSDLRWYSLASGPVTGHFWLSPTNPAGCLVVEGMPALGPDQVYQVWLIRDGTPRNGGTFNARDGSGWVLVRPDQPLTTFTGISITVEPPGGSPAPTGPEVLGGQFRTDL